MARRQDNGWQVDRHIPAAVILAMIFQFAGGVWYASQLSQRMVDVERQTAELAIRGERLTRLEAKFDAMVERLTEIRQALSQIAAPYAAPPTQRPFQSRALLPPSR